MTSLQRPTGVPCLQARWDKQVTMLRQVLSTLAQVDSNVDLAINHYWVVRQHPHMDQNLDYAWWQVMVSLKTHEKVYSQAITIRAKLHRTSQLDRAFARRKEICDGVWTGPLVICISFQCDVITSDLQNSCLCVSRLNETYNQ